jgi:hypothetical protein
MNSITHHTARYALRAVDSHYEKPPERPPESGPSELLDIARRLRLVPPRCHSGHQAHDGSQACSVVVITGYPARYKSSEFRRVGVDWVLVTVALEALDHLLHEGDTCIAVFTEVDLPGADSGYDVIEALATSGFEGPSYLIATHEPLARDRDLARRRGASGIVRGHAASMLQVLDDVLASGATDHGKLMDLPSTDGPCGAYGLPSWTRPVIRRLARLVGPTAGDHVRNRYALMSTRYRRPPDPVDLIEEVSEVLNDWPLDRLCFVEQCRDIREGSR